MYTSPCGQAGMHRPVVSSQRSSDQQGRAQGSGARTLAGGATDDAPSPEVDADPLAALPPGDGLEHAQMAANAQSGSARGSQAIGGRMARRSGDGQADASLVVSAAVRSTRGEEASPCCPHGGSSRHGRLHGAACVAGFLLSLAWISTSTGAGAFPRVVRAGETLAQIAERMYGRVEMEQLLVAANGLDQAGGIAVVPGMRLEVPAVSHYRVSAGETWAGLAKDLLGDAERSDVMSMANGSMPWLAPADGQEIIVPYNLRYVVAQGDSTLTVAYRFLGERDKAWMLDRYNRLKGDPLRRGQVVLVPLTELPLTAEGKAEAANAGALVRAEGGGRARDAQRKADADLPLLAGEVRNGRYVDAVVRAARLLGSGELSKPQLASIHRHLTEAYTALEAPGLAETACGSWRENDPTAVLDPIELSPKILRACTGAPAPRQAPQSSASAPATSSPSPLEVPAEVRSRGFDERSEEKRIAPRGVSGGRSHPDGGGVDGARREQSVDGGK